MNSQDHTQWTDQLSDFLDGGLDEPAFGTLEEHLGECGACRAVLAELRSVRDAAAALEAPAPERDLWPGIAAVIGGTAATPPAQAGVIELPTARVVEPSLPGLFLTMPQMAAAAVVLVVTSVALTWAVGPGIGTRSIGDPGPITEAPVSMAADLAEPPADLVEELALLEGVLAEARARLDPNTIRILEKNLQVIERAIDDSKRALAVDPGNAFLRDHLEGAYREKASYLREATDLVQWIG
jgi:hypothetical protein